MRVEMATAALSMLPSAVIDRIEFGLEDEGKFLISRRLKNSSCCVDQAAGSSSVPSYRQIIPGESHNSPHAWPAVAASHKTRITTSTQPVTWFREAIANAAFFCLESPRQPISICSRLHRVTARLVCAIFPDISLKLAHSSRHHPFLHSSHSLRRQSTFSILSTAHHCFNRSCLPRDKRARLSALQ